MIRSRHSVVYFKLFTSESSESRHRIAGIDRLYKYYEKKKHEFIKLKKTVNAIGMNCCCSANHIFFYEKKKQNLHATTTTKI